MRKGVTASIFLLTLLLSAAIVVISRNLAGGKTITDIIGGVRVSCYDGDNGNDIYSKATCSDRFGTFDDYCTDNTVVEYECGSTNKCVASYIDCPEAYACGNGACVLLETAS